MTHLISYYITIIRIKTLLYQLWLLYILYHYIYVCWVWMEAAYINCHGVVGCSPRISCSRIIDDEILARPVKDMDLLFLGSVHPVPREDCSRRWQSMARRVPNSLVQWAHRNPRACGAFLRLSWPAGRIKQGISLQGPAIFLGQLAG